MLSWRKKPAVKEVKQPGGTPLASVTEGSVLSGSLPAKLLVANRGEIAVRLCKTAHKLGVPTVAIYTAADIGSSHIRAADERYEVPSYLDEEAIVNIAVQTSCTAVIPGYGFLSENVSFAEKCERAGIEFCGPSPEVLSTFGLKHTARAAAKQAGVPICAGTDVLETGAVALAWAQEVGVQYPLIFKAIAGGGGIGMVRVDKEDEIEAAFDTASRNATKAFGDGRMYVEQMLLNARHIEVQIFGDGNGDAVALGTRECSVQRRNQKVVEEAPAPNVPAERLREVEACAAKLACSVRGIAASEIPFHKATRLHARARRLSAFACVGVRAGQLQLGGHGRVSARRAMQLLLPRGEHSLAGAEHGALELGTSLLQRLSLPCPSSEPAFCSTLSPSARP